MGYESRKPDEDDIKIGKRIRKAREAKRLPRQALADYLRISHQQFYRYENGMSCISAKMLSRVAKFLKTPTLLR